MQWTCEELPVADKDFTGNKEKHVLGSICHMESLELEDELRNVAVDLDYLIKVNCIIESKKGKEG